MKQTTQEAHDDFILRCECELADLAAGWGPSDLRNARVTQVTSDLRNAVRREKRRLERAAKITAANAARAAEVERQRVGGLI